MAEQAVRWQPCELESRFGGAADLNVRALQIGGHTLHTYAIDGLTSGGDISDFVFRPLTERLRGETMQALYDNALRRVVYNSVAVACRTPDEAAHKLVNGFCIVLFPAVGALAFEDKTAEKRAPAAPEVEKTVKGAKDAFTETIRTNTSLIRRHLRTPALRIYETVVGTKSLTNVGVLSVAGVTEPDYVARVRERLDTLRVAELLSPAAAEEYLTGPRRTAFPLLQYTERTDKFCQGLMAGRVGVLIDGLPLGYLLPVDVAYLMTSPEDTGMGYIAASCTRVLRYAALLISLLLPALYTAMATFHQQMLPTKLLLAIIESKASVPFPTVLEVLGLLLAFELLQEAGLSLPQSIGQTVSIIGGLVVGSAAVEAKLISPAALIVVSIAGICGFVLPSRDFSDAVRIWRFALAVCASFVGIFGVTLGVLVLLVHLAGLTSLGVAYLQPFSEVRGAARLLRPRKTATGQEDE